MSLRLTTCHAAFLALVIILFISCSQPAKQVAPDTPSGWEEEELRGKVKQIIHINNTFATPEQMAFSQEDFETVTMLCYYIALQAYCEANEIENVDDIIAGRADEPEDFEYFAEDQGADCSAYTVYQYDRQGNMTSEQYYAETLDEQPSRQLTYAYDDHHRVLRTEYFYPGQTLMWYREQTYNEDGFETREYFKPSDGDALEFRYQYDALNHLTSQERYVNGQLHSARAYVYDKAGNQLEDNWQSGDSPTDLKYTYYTDGAAKNRQASCIRYDLSGKVLNSQYFVYSDDMKERVEYYVEGLDDTTMMSSVHMDERGNVLEVSMDYHTQQPYSISTYTCDEHDNVTLFEWQGDDADSYYRSEYVYDEQNRQISSSIFSLNMGPLRTRTETVYGQNDRVSLINTYMQVVHMDDEAQSEPERLTMREVYQYDEHDNWISHETYYTDIKGTELLMRKETREIEYY